MVFLKKMLTRTCLALLPIFFNQSFASERQNVQDSPLSAQDRAIDMKSPVCQGGKVYSLQEAVPGSPLYELHSFPAVYNAQKQLEKDKPEAQSLVNRAQGADVPLDVTKPSKLERPKKFKIAVKNYMDYFLVLKALPIGRLEGSGVSGKIFSENYSVRRNVKTPEDPAFVITTEQEAFWLKIERLGRTDCTLFEGVLHSFNKEEVDLQVTALPKSHRLHIGIKNCAIDQRLSLAEEHDSPLKGRLSSEEINRCFVTVSNLKDL